MSSVMPMPLAMTPSFTVLAQQSASLRARAGTLCRRSDQVRARFCVLVVRAAAARERIPPPRFSPLVSPPASTPVVLPIGGGAATEAVLRDYIYQTCLAPGDAGLGDEEHLLANGILDSLGILRLVAFIEETFGVNVPDEALVPENFGTVRRVAALVERLETADHANRECPVAVGVGD